MEAAFSFAPNPPAPARILGVFSLFQYSAP
jgi:hypothetical protein